MFGLDMILIDFDGFHGRSAGRSAWCCRPRPHVVRVLGRRPVPSRLYTWSCNGGPGFVLEVGPKVPSPRLRPYPPLSLWVKVRPGRRCHGKLPSSRPYDVLGGVWCRPDLPGAVTEPRYFAWSNVGHWTWPGVFLGFELIFPNQVRKLVLTPCKLASEWCISI